MTLPADRRLKDRRVFATLPEGWPDGMAVDVEGGVWVAVVRYGEVVRFKANGTMERRIKMPVEMVTSLCFGGADMMDLYVVTADNTEDASRKGTIFRMRADVPGLGSAEGTVLEGLEGRRHDAERLSHKKETRMALQVGQQAPDFTMKSNKMKDVKLSELRGSKVLLLFVPLAFTGT